MIKLRRLFYKVFPLDYADSLVDELRKVEASGIEYEDDKILMSAFSWADSPAGKDFWLKAYKKLPEKYQ